MPSMRRRRWVAESTVDFTAAAGYRVNLRIQSRNSGSRLWRVRSTDSGVTEV